jgi:dCTP diphosphatase
VEKLRSAISQFVSERDWKQFHSPKNLAMALSVEVSEIAEHFQWLTQEQSRNLPPEKLRAVTREIGDAMIYLVELSDELGVDPIKAATEKVNTNSSKYPADLVRGKAAKYTEYQ